MSVSYPIYSSLGANWSKVLDALGSERRGELLTDVAPGAEVALVAAPGAGEYWVLHPDRAQAITVPAHKELHARVTGGGAGPVVLSGQLVAE